MDSLTKNYHGFGVGWLALVTACASPAQPTPLTPVSVQLSFLHQVDFIAPVVNGAAGIGLRAAIVFKWARKSGVHHARQIQIFTQTAKFAKNRKI